MHRRSFTLRLPEELAHKLSTVASVLNQTQANVIRDCLDAGLDGLVEGEEFQNALRSRIDAQHQLLSYAPADDAEDASVELLARVK
jgi:predicted transcriptional regulator|tara:strand:- start:242 stop:499 length:258 start_codon:yes stop_codon:yes gene_type:complete